MAIFFAALLKHWTAGDKTDTVGADSIGEMTDGGEPAGKEQSK